MSRLCARAGLQWAPGGAAKARAVTAGRRSEVPGAFIIIMNTPTSRPRLSQTDWRACNSMCNPMFRPNVGLQGSVFEITIRYLGGLLSAYQFTKDEVVFFSFFPSTSTLF